MKESQNYNMFLVGYIVNYTQTFAGNGGCVCNVGSEARKAARPQWLRQDDRRVLGSVSETVGRYEIPPKPPQL